jgi:hypothetical protein
VKAWCLFAIRDRAQNRFLHRDRQNDINVTAIDIEN